MQTIFKCLAFVIVALSTLRCETENNCVSGVKTLSHQNGRSFEVPGCTKFTSIQLDDGFKLVIDPSDTRSIYELQLRISSNKPPGLDKTRTVNAIQYFYRKAIFEEGSGGQEHSLSIWKPLPDGHGVYLDYYVQSSEFDEGYAWQIIMSTRVNESPPKPVTVD